jgi:hypothetical protein
MGECDEKDTTQIKLQPLPVTISNLTNSDEVIVKFDIPQTSKTGQLVMDYDQGSGTVYHHHLGKITLKTSGYVSIPWNGVYSPPDSLYIRANDNDPYSLRVTRLYWRPDCETFFQKYWPPIIIISVVLVLFILSMIYVVRLTKRPLTLAQQEAHENFLRRRA